MASKKITDEQVEAEIQRLTASDEVKLARAYNRYKERRRQYLYNLRLLSKQGKALMKLGFTAENLLEKLEDQEVWGA